MYSESDIEAAVASGAITAEAAAALRHSVAEDRSAPAVDEESFRLLTGFNDIFVTIAIILLLVAVGWIGGSIGGGTEHLRGESQPRFGSSLAVAALLIAGVSWALAEYFTRVRRMALPSIVLLGSFVYGIGFALFGISVVAGGNLSPRVAAIVMAGVGVGAAVAAYFHWCRFHVPITIAALTGALALTLVSLATAAVPGVAALTLWLSLAAGIGIFAFAMWWDISDRSRVTRRSDVAFWLHLTAAPMIAHPIFWLLGVMDGEMGAAKGVLVVLLYILFGLVALAVDRRALLVSSLFYVLFAMSALFRQFGAIGLNVAFTALVIGSALLMLSAFWHPIRRQVVLMLPARWQGRLPAMDRPAPIPRPA